MTSDYSSINQDGEVNFKGGKIGGWTIGESSLSCDIVPPYDYTESDRIRIQQIMLGTITPTQEDYNKYDFDKNGVINAYDLGVCQKLVTYNLMNSNPGKLIFDTSNWFMPIRIVNSSGETVSAFGVNGVYTKEINE